MKDYMAIARQHAERVSYLGERPDGMRYWSLLATSPSDDALNEWGMDVWPDPLDRRGNTVRVRLWIGEGMPTGRLADAIEAAEKRDVTLQLLCLHGVDESTREKRDLGNGASVSAASFLESYPVLHLGTHGQKWGTEESEVGA